MLGLDNGRFRSEIGSKIRNRINRRLEYQSLFPSKWVCRFRRGRFDGFHGRSGGLYRF